MGPSLSPPAAAWARLLPLVAAVAGPGGAVAGGDTCAAGECRLPRRFSCVEHSTGTLVDYPPTGLSPGDAWPWLNEVYDASDTQLIGSNQGVCFALTPTSWECVFSFSFGVDGQLMLEGPWEAGLGKVTALAVTGGTGCLASARGQATMTKIQNEPPKYRYDIELRCSDELCQEASESMPSGGTAAALQLQAQEMGLLSGLGSAPLPQRFSFVERDIGGIPVDLPPAGTTPGDLYEFASELYDAGNVQHFGRDRGYCLAAAAGLWECTWTFFLPSGSQLTAEGPWKEGPGKVSQLAITGGTGSLATARGQMTMTTLREATATEVARYRYDVDLACSAEACRLPARFTFTERDPGVLTDYGANGRSRGDTYVWVNGLYDTGGVQRLGTGQGRCMAVTGALWECAWTLQFLADGQLTLAGTWEDGPGKAAVLAVTGGTGCFATARGQVTRTTVQEPTATEAGRYRYEVQLGCTDKLCEGQGDPALGLASAVHGQLEQPGVPRAVAALAASALAAAAGGLALVARRVAQGPRTPGSWGQQSLASSQGEFVAEQCE